MNTTLSLEISETSNLKVMRLYDTSAYYTDETIENYLVEVLPVNKSAWLTFNVKKGFSLVLNSSNLKYNKAAAKSQLIDLPDGVYEIKQSIKPNILTANHFYYLRNSKLSNDISSQKSKLLSNECKISRQDYVLSRDKLIDIEEYMKASKWMIEECHDVKKGKELYEFSKKQLDNYTNECKCK